MKFAPELVPVADCKPYRSGDDANYRHHPHEQVAEIFKSLDEFGQYKNIVISSDGYILAGEGVWLSCKMHGDKDIAVIRMEFPASDPRAAKLLVADNELSGMAEDNDTQLAGLLKGLQETVGLEGTGYDGAGLQELLDELQVAEAVPDFEPVSVDEQGRLDQLEPKWVQCPNCGETFDNRQTEEFEG